MIEWKSIKKSGYPENDCLCVILNAKRRTEEIAIYQSEEEIFIYYNYQRGFPTEFPLDATHYIVLPEHPLEDN